MNFSRKSAKKTVKKQVNLGKVLEISKQKAVGILL
jgi:hypothetical protein